MKTQDLKAGDRFFFGGDWQTEPGNWEVVTIDDLTGGPVCRPVGRTDESLFHHNVTVEAVRAEMPVDEYWS